MKPIKFLLFGIAVIAMSLSSCKKDEDEQSTSEYPFSKESVSANKAKIEDAGQDLITELDNMANTEATPVLQVFAQYCETDNPFGQAYTPESAPLIRTIGAASKIAAGSEALKALSAAMKSDVLEDPESIGDIYNQIKGTYTWNGSAWVITTSATVKFVFPSEAGSDDNNAALTITYKGESVTSPVGGYEGDFPKEVNVTLLVDEEKIYEMDLKASYNDDGVPSSVNYFVALYPFKYELIFSNNESNLSLQYKLTNDGNIILDCLASLNGNFSVDNIEDSEGPQEVLDNAEVYFQVFNVKLTGSIDLEKIIEAQKDLQNGDYDDEKEAMEAMVDELNKYIHIDLVFADSKEKIATAEAYVYEYEGYYGHTYYDINFRLVFDEDGTGSDLEAYFGEGFEDLIEDFNKFIGEFSY